MENFDPAKPDDQLPLLPPEADVESKTILKNSVAARAAQVELKQVNDLVANQTVLP